MQLNFKKSQSSVKPELVDTTSSKTTVYIRQNIVEKEATDSSSIIYEYDEAKLTKEEYKQYLADLDVNTLLKTVESLKEENVNLNSQVEILTQCVLEMSETVYA